MVAKKDLVDGGWYRGHHRCQGIAKWAAKEDAFLYVEFSMGCYGIAFAKHPEDDDGYALFIPFERVETGVRTKEESMEVVKWGRQGEQD